MKTTKHHERLTFYDYVSIQHSTLPPDLRQEFLDKVMTSIELQKDTIIPEEIKGLQVRARVTHTSRLTGHFHYYGSAGTKAGIDSFTHPFEKPVLHEHEDDTDPLGRIKSASYVSTNPVILAPSFVDRLDRIVKYGEKELKLIDKLRPYLYDNNWEGLGYVESLANITDEDAIRKIIDGRYHTISIGYGTDALYCSECGTDWLADGKCEHDKGIDYGKGPAFLIFGNMEYDEWSYVKSPADTLAQTEELKKVTIPVSFADKSKMNRRKLAMLTASADSMKINDPLRVPMTKALLYVYNQTTDSYVPQQISDNTKKPGDTTMKLQELKSLGKDLYAKLNELIEQEDMRLTDEQIEALQDTDFVGANRLLIANSKEYVDASLKILETVEDSDQKTELVTFLEEREKQFSESTETDNTTDGDAQAEPEVETNKDYVEYGFVLKGEGWGLPDPDSQNYEYEKQILELLLGMYAGKPKDAINIIDSILNKLGEDKDTVLTELAKTKIDEMQSRLDNFKNEIQTLKDSSAASQKTVENLTLELKDTLADKIASFKRKEDPNLSNEEIIDSLKSQTVDELRATAKNFALIIGDEPVTIKPVKDNTLKHTDNNNEDEVEVTQEYIDAYVKEVEGAYQSMFRRNGAAADKYLIKQQIKIQALRNSLKTKNSESNQDTEE